MGYPDHMSTDVAKLLEHIGHELTVAIYAGENVSLECETCCEVLSDVTSEGR